ncbi:malate/lactate dehydrogenases [Lactococcus lactis subsp. lactis]|uniref:Malate/lactate dehydrogenases n=1 Tax=Lactococcus lactis subsp. lactis TaxID=1360 RepID=A0A0B8QJL3_LACLL|nr:malate/lactate dehydrogenases [Lactococcus lactis subsp. lactis]
MGGVSVVSEVAAFSEMFGCSVVVVSEAFSRVFSVLTANSESIISENDVFVLKA